MDNISNPQQVADAIELGRLKSAAWTAIREFGATQLPAAGEAATQAALAVDVACEDYRRKYHPNAGEVFVLCDDEIGQVLAVYTRSKSRFQLVFEAQV